MVLALVLGALAAVLGGALYAAADLYIPLIYANALIAFGLGFGLGAVPMGLMRWGCVRSNFFVYLVVLAVSVVGYYASWTTWIWLLIYKAPIHPGPIWLFVHPKAVWEVAQAVNENGTWTLSENDKTPVQGVMLWVVWICEAGLIFGSAWWTARKMNASQPFCESCNRWCGKPRRLGTGPMKEIGQVRQQLEQGQFQSLAPLTNTPPDPCQWLAYYHHTCSGCGQLNTLTVKKVNMTKTRKGKTVTKIKTVINGLLLHPGEAELLLGKKEDEQTEPATTP
jgi:hypothetical protein